MPEPEVLAMLSHSQEFEQVKVSTLTGIRPQYAINRVVVPIHREFSVLFSRQRINDNVALFHCVSNLLFGRNLFLTSNLTRQEAKSTVNGYSNLSPRLPFCYE